MPGRTSPESRDTHCKKAFRQRNYEFVGMPFANTRKYLAARLAFPSTGRARTIPTIRFRRLSSAIWTTTCPRPAHTSFTLTMVPPPLIPCTPLTKNAWFHWCRKKAMGRKTGKRWNLKAPGIPTMPGANGCTFHCGFYYTKMPVNRRNERLFAAWGCLCSCSAASLFRLLFTDFHFLMVQINGVQVVFSDITRCMFPSLKWCYKSSCPHCAVSAILQSWGNEPAVLVFKSKLDGWLLFTGAGLTFFPANRILLRILLINGWLRGADNYM